MQLLTTKYTLKSFLLWNSQQPGLFGPNTHHMSSIAINSRVLHQTLQYWLTFNERSYSLSSADLSLILDFALHCRLKWIKRSLRTFLTISWAFLYFIFVFFSPQHKYCHTWPSFNLVFWYGGDFVSSLQEVKHCIKQIFPRVLVFHSFAQTSSLEWNLSSFDE